MYYSIGSYGKNQFIYNTLDDSCECISCREFVNLRKSGVDLLEGWKPISFAKCRMVCNIPSFNVLCNLPLVSFKVKASQRDGDKLFSYYSDWLDIGIYIINSDYLAYYSDEYKDFYLSCGYSSKFFVFLSINGSDYLGNGQFRRLYYNYSSEIGVRKDIVLCWGALMPLDLLSYIIRLRERRDTDKFFKALRGYDVDRIFVGETGLVEHMEVSWSTLGWSQE